MQKQQVYLGVTRSGVRGLFTNGWLVCPLKEGDDPATKARRMGFEYVPAPD